MNPKYPVYVISKGRWKSRLTSKTLEDIGVPYSIVVEPTEEHDYGEVIDPAKILVLPFANLGQGSIPARNWVWQHALETGAERHWILDDNIDGFFRYNHNQTVRVADGAIFRAAEDFVDRYENVAEAGFHYEAFMHWARERNKEKPPFYLNTRIYSCILLRNDLPHRWRGRYNEDTDLSLRLLKDGWVTVLFNAFCAGKQPTMTMAGGNTDELYHGDGRREMAESLVAQHPDVAQVITRFGRPQHYVDYGRFKANRLVRRPGKELPPGFDEYGMVLEERLDDGTWVPVTEAKT